MKPSVYLETTIASYLTAWPSADIVVSARQQVTRQWWDERSQDFELYASEIVLLESAAGDPEAAKRRLEFLTGLPLLEPKADSGQHCASAR